MQRCFIDHQDGVVLSGRGTFGLVLQKNCNFKTLASALLIIQRLYTKAISNSTLHVYKLD